MTTIDDVIAAAEADCRRTERALTIAREAVAGLTATARRKGRSAKADPAWTGLRQAEMAALGDFEAADRRLAMLQAERIEDEIIDRRQAEVTPTNVRLPGQTTTTVER